MENPLAKMDLNFRNAQGHEYDLPDDNKGHYVGKTAGGKRLFVVGAGTENEAYGAVRTEEVLGKTG